ncbi:LysR family transcriptional regulator [Bdellovibrio sp. HCB337]|uniref:LysR family transcriptional regulator n=1 Tax=Bdellovibrio sp. HCB337 TaxID=3394358 RepID=UPI0039A786F5
MPKIPIHLIEAFISFSQTQNVQAAANRLGISQPALSKQLMALEKMLPQAIFTFRGRQKVLTAFGEELRVQLQEKLEGLQEIIEHTALSHADPSKSYVKIASRREILDRFADKLKFPGTLQLVESANAPTITGLINRTLDFGIVHQVPNTSELVAKPLFRDHFMIVIPKKLLKTPPTKIKDLWSELIKLPCICYKNPDEILGQICQSHGVNFDRLNITRVTANYLSVAKLVNAGVGWAAMPTHISTVSANNHIIPVPLKTFAPRQFYGVFRPELKNAPWLRLLLSELDACFIDQK